MDQRGENEGQDKKLDQLLKSIKDMKKEVKNQTKSIEEMKEEVKNVKSDTKEQFKVLQLENQKIMSNQKTLISSYNSL